MKESYDKAFPITIGLEGRYSDDPDDPGNYYPDGSPGFTYYGLCTMYNPLIKKDWTLDQIKDYYYEHYWIPADCNDAPFPMDIILFDGFVNPQRGGNKELLDMKPENWQEFLIFRMQRYMRYSNPTFVKGHLFRVLKLCGKIKELEKCQNS
jgi:hypothetical protein